MYEVHHIDETECFPEIQLTIFNLVTDELIRNETIKTSVFISPSLQITILGNYNHLQDIISKSLVKPYNRTGPVYLEHTSIQNRPIKHTIGEIQLRHPNSTHSIFDSNLIECSSVQTAINCMMTKSVLHQIEYFPIFKLPARHNNHFFHLKKGQLMSMLYRANPTIISLKYTNLEISVYTSEACPDLIEVKNIKGCYSCDTLSFMTITAQTTCKEGIADVSIANISVYTKTIHLQEKAQDYLIQFLSTIKCLQTEICIKTTLTKSCKIADFCLDEPTFILLGSQRQITQYNDPYTPPESKDNSSIFSKIASGFFDLLSYLPGFQFLSFVTNYIKNVIFTIVFIMFIFFIFAFILICCRK